MSFFSKLGRAVRNAGKFVTGNVTRAASSVANFATQTALPGIVQVGNEVGGIATTIGETTASQVTSYSLSAVKGVTSVTGEAIEWTKTSADAVRDWTVDAAGSVADFSKDAFDETVEALSDAWEFVNDLGAYTLPKLTWDESVRTAVPGLSDVADAVSSAAVAMRATLLLKFSVGPASTWVFVDRDGLWGYGGDLNISFNITKASVSLFVLFRSRAEASEAKYRPWGLSYPPFEGNAILSPNFHFYGFQVAMRTDMLASFLGKSKSDKGGKLKLTKPVSTPGLLVDVATDTGLRDLLTVAPSIDAGARAAQKAHATNPADAASFTAALGTAADSVKNTALAAASVGSPLFVWTDASGVPQVTPGFSSLAPDASRQVAQIIGSRFAIAPAGDFTRARFDRCLSYRKPDNSVGRLTLNRRGHLVISAGQTTVTFTFNGATGGARTGQLYVPYLVHAPHTPSFLHAPGGDFDKAHKDTIIAYTSGTSSWVAKLLPNHTFQHAPNGDFSKAHVSSEIAYVAADGSAKRAFIQHDARGRIVFKVCEENNRAVYTMSTDLVYRHSGQPWTARVVSSPDFANGHPDVRIAYQNHVRQAFWARLLPDGTLQHAPNGDWSKAFPAREIWFTTADGTAKKAYVVTDAEGRLQFKITDYTDTSKFRISDEIVYLSGDSVWTARVVSPMLTPAEASDTAAYFALADGSCTTDIRYLCADGSRWVARLSGASFVHAPEGDFARSHTDTRINYLAGDGSAWWAQIVRDSAGRYVLQHSQGSRSHQDTYMSYLTWERKADTAAPYFPGG